FDPLPFGEDQVQTLTVHNVGGAPLEVDYVEVRGSAAFVVPHAPFGERIGVGDSLTLDVVWTSTSPEDQGELVIFNTDRVNQALPVPLLGSAVAPALLVEPNPVDF